MKTVLVRTAAFAASFGLALLFALVAFPTNAASSLQAQHATALRLDFEGGGLCSGTAVGRHVILTATHCLSSTLKTVQVLDGSSPAPAQIAAVISDGADHSFVLTTYKFERWSKGIRMNPPLPDYSERFHYWGNPMGLTDMYREGYVVGHCMSTLCFPTPDVAAAIGVRQTALVSVMGQRGDSGAAIFNDRGQIVGIVSLIQDQLGRPPFVPLAVVEFAFTPEQLRQVEAWR